MRALTLLEYEALEEEDWDYSRNRRVFLKWMSCDWSSSTYSTTLRIDELKLTGPNRDCPYEGLLAYVEGEPWKFLDGIYFTAGVELKPKSVKVNPFKAIYEYSTSKGLVSLQIEVPEVRIECLKCSFNAELSCTPIIDIRHIYEDSKPRKHSFYVEKARRVNWLICLRDDKALAIGPILDFKPLNTVIEWIYKYGDGFRVKTDRGVFFRRVTRKLFIPALITIKDQVFFIPLRRDELRRLGEVKLSEFKGEINSKQRVKENLRELVRLRVECFRKLYSSILKHGFPEAGGWWFKTIWLRDFFESVYWNVETIRRIGFLNETVEGILKSLSYQSKRSGLIPLRLPERREVELSKEHYAGVDQSLLALILAQRLSESRLCGDLISKALSSLRLMIKCFKSNSLNEVDGPPVLTSNGLISCVPWYSWTDSRKSCLVNGSKIKVSTRIPDEWVRGAVSGGDHVEVEEEFNKPKYLLPEVNAMWLKCLHLYSNLDDSIKNLYLKASKSFKETFWSDEWGFIHDIVALSGLKSSVESSMALVALHYCGNLFDERELEKAFRVVESKLLVYWKLVKLGEERLPFGVLVKNSGKRIYLGDEEYHEAVVWPRDTPYLIDLAWRLSKVGFVKGVLMSVLDESISEGAILYSGEVYSLPEGVNPAPSPAYSSNPLPVKNQIQLWSQWCDPFLKHLRYLF